MVIESSQHLMQHIDNGGSFSLDNHGRLQEQSDARRFFQNIGDAFLRWSAPGRASIDERNNRLGNAMHAIVARDNPLRNLAEEALPQGGRALSTGGAKMLARMEIGRQLVNFPPDTRPVVKRELMNAYKNLDPTSSTGILKSIEEKAKELLNTPDGRLYTDNQTMIYKINMDDEEVNTAIAVGKLKGLECLDGTEIQDALDLHNIPELMATKIASSPTKVTPQMLEDMVEKTVRERVVKCVIRDLVDNDPQSKKLTPKEKNDFVSDLMEFPQAKAILDAPTPRAAELQADIMKSAVALDLLYDRNYKEIKHDLLNAGLKDFCAKTGLTAEEGKKLNTKALEDEMARSRKELDQTRLANGDPKIYHRSGRGELSGKWDEMSKEFFAVRAKEYNELGPEVDKEAWFRKA